ncbi:unnamed protein product [Rotaria sordida]|uniref:Ribonucleoside-diphosphate reductase large subunit n=1 Tax=Rotaria sordida TaxID=392033 RepID=A0A813P719_9BILA|nr:unnamed protein product [Rotaria sordida]
MRRLPEGGVLHIEHIQDQVELALMRAGEQEVARGYVLYREARSKERAELNAALPAAVQADSKGPTVTRVDGTTVSFSDLALDVIIKEACAGHGDVVDFRKIMEATLESLYEGVPEGEKRKQIMLSFDDVPVSNNASTTEAKAETATLNFAPGPAAAAVVPQVTAQTVTSVSVVPAAPSEAANETGHVTGAGATGVEAIEITDKRITVDEKRIINCRADLNQLVLLCWFCANAELWPSEQDDWCFRAIPVHHARRVNAPQLWR